MNNLPASIERLKTLWQTIQAVWHTTQTQWHDPVQQAFTREVWQPLQTQVAATHRELVNLAEVIAEAKRRVE